jgi:coenzyme Q-binding protein COQ10
LATITRIEIVGVPRKDLYAVIADYESYPDFVPHIVHARIINEDLRFRRVQFKAHYLRDISYTLDIFHDEPRRIWWELVESPLIKVSSGSWELRSKGNSKTEVEYSVQVVPRIFVPYSIVEALTRSGIPSLINAFVGRARQGGPLSSRAREH